jgi:ribosomal-protein-alanine N-acetyltransferase
MRLRAADPSDVDALMTFEEAIYGPEAWSRELMIAELANPHGHYLVAVDDADAVVAYAGLLAPLGTGQGDIQTVTVSPDARRQGLGRTLMLRLIDEARRRGAEELFLEVRHDNDAAQTLYRDLGFREIGRRKNYYGPGADALTMMLDVGARS